MAESGKGKRGTAKNVRAYSAKDRIDHSVFGLGTILEIDERHTTIAFDETGTRKFVTSMVKLAPSDTEAPARRVRTKKKAAKKKVTKKAATKKAATKKTATKKAATKKAATKKAATKKEA